MALAERDITVEGHRVHLWEGGEGFPILMLHGSGPGAGTIGNWRLVLEPLAARYRIVATDLIGFGASGRKTEEPYFDLPLWRRQAQAVLDLLPAGEVGVIGHSLSASLALGLAMDNPRVTRVMTTGAMGAPARANRETEICWRFPETREELREAAEILVHDPSVITDAFLDARMAILHDGEYGPYFRSMFAGDKQRYHRRGGAPARSVVVARLPGDDAPRSRRPALPLRGEHARARPPYSEGRHVRDRRVRPFAGA